MTAFVEDFITCQREDFDPECKDWKRWVELFDAHAMELRGMKSNIDVQQYLKLQSEGRLVLITARDGSGTLQGYSSHFWHKDLHFGLRVAQDDAWFTFPDLRNLGIGKRLRQMALEELKKDGVVLAFGRLKTAHPHDESMSSLGYEPWEQVYLKVL